MEAGDMITADNCIWDDDGLVQRKGHRPYETGDYLTSDAIVGVSKRVYLNSTWVDFIAVDDDVNAEVRIYRRTTTSKTLVSSTLVMTQGINVYFAELGGKVIAVNGTDKPIVMYYSSGWVVSYFDTLDTRTWDETTWNAGQYDADGTPYDDDTTDAQDTGANDFQLGSTTNDDGFWIASANPFTKVVLDDAEQAGGSPVASYQYYAADLTWKTLTLTTTPTWTAAAGDRTMEWDYNSDMARYAAAAPGLANYFCIRVRFTTAASGAFSCDEIAVYHTHYLDEALGGTIPKRIGSHNSRMFFGVGTLAYFTPPNAVTGIRGPSEAEYFLEGGPEIRALVSTRNYLLAFKDNATYAFYGNTVEDFLRKKVSDVGLSEDKAWAVTEIGVFFLAADGIHLQNGQADIRISEHINSDIESFTATGAVATYFEGKVWFSFPASSVGLWFDPATLSVDETTGEGRVNFFKFTSFDVDHFINENGNGDTGYLLAGVNGTIPYIARLDNGESDQQRDTTEVAITMDARIPYLPFGQFLKKKIWGRLLTKLKKDASTATTYTLTLYSNKGDASASVSIAVAAGTGDHVQESRVPYTLDGYNLSIRIQNATVTSAGLTGVALEYEHKEL